MELTSKHCTDDVASASATSPPASRELSDVELEGLLHCLPTEVPLPCSTLRCRYQRGSPSVATADCLEADGKTRVTG